MLDHREDSGGSNWEPGAAKGSSLRLKSLFDAPTLENGYPGVFQIPWKMGTEEFLKLL